MLLEVITPDELIYKGNVSHVIFPGLDGSFGVLTGHALLISALIKGNIKVEQNVDENRGEEFDGLLNKKHKDDKEFVFEIKGGVVEVKNDSIIVLAE